MPIRWRCEGFLFCLMLVIDMSSEFRCIRGRVWKVAAVVGLCTRVILDLMEGKYFSSHDITQITFTSAILYPILCDQGINACGTTRSNRKLFPKKLVTFNTGNNRGHYDCRSNGPILDTFWIDTGQYTYSRLPTWQTPHRQ